MCDVDCVVITDPRLSHLSSLKVLRTAQNGQKRQGNSVCKSSLAGRFAFFLEGLRTRPVHLYSQTQKDWTRPMWTSLYWSFVVHGLVLILGITGHLAKLLNYGLVDL